jgi:glycosyltransferase involved in cell wall biosynthesis
MNILLVHNYYQFRGGEDAVVEADKSLLESRGHRVVTYFVYSKDIASQSRTSKFLILLQIPFRLDVYRNIQNIIKCESIDIVHIHNIWPLISPSVLFACNKLKIPWVQTIHNYRYIVPDAILNYDDVATQSRKLTIKSRALNCFKDSILLTQIYRFTAWLTRASGCVDRGSGVLQVLNQFGFDIHAQRFSSNRLRIRGNFVPESDVGRCVPRIKKNFNLLFLGRLSNEKGIEVLCKAWRKAKIIGKLKIAGTGPLEEQLRAEFGNDQSIEFLGFVSGQKKFDLIAESSALVVPSVWIEPFGLVIAESFFCGTPVIASRVGSLPEMVEEGKTGFLFEPGCITALASLIEQCSRNVNELKYMGAASRTYAEQSFSESISYDRLMEIYFDLLK